MKKYTPLEIAFNHVSCTPSEMNEHARTLKSLASESNRIAEFGVRFGLSTVCLMAGKPKNIFSYDIDPTVDPSRFDYLADAKTEFKFQYGDSCQVVIPEVDLLFIDTEHTYEQLSRELRWNESKVSHRIVCHDTENPPDLLRAIREFCAENWNWEIIQHYPNNYGLTILERRSWTMPKKTT